MSNVFNKFYFFRQTVDSELNDNQKVAETTYDQLRTY